MLRPALKRLVLAGGFAICFAWGVAHAAPPALVFVGNPNPSGADEALLALARARGLVVAREALGSLEEEPRARLHKAVEAFARLQLPDARARLDALEGEAAAGGAAGLTRGELIELFATRATLRLAAGNEGGAWDDLLQVAAFSPARPLDPARFPPKVLETERRAAEALAAGGKLTAIVTPADATLFVDGLAAGRGQAELVLPAGRHFVRAERLGFSGAGRTIEVTPAGATLSLALSPRPTPPRDSFVNRAAQLGRKQAVGAWIGAHGATAELELVLLEVPGGQARGQTSLPLGPRLTDAALAAALDLLVPPASTLPAEADSQAPLVLGSGGRRGGGGGARHRPRRRALRRRTSTASRHAWICGARDEALLLALLCACSSGPSLITAELRVATGQHPLALADEVTFALDDATDRTLALERASPSALELALDPVPAGRGYRLTLEGTFDGDPLARGQSCRFDVGAAAPPVPLYLGEVGRFAATGAPSAQRRGAVAFTDGDSGAPGGRRRRPGSDGDERRPTRRPAPGSPRPRP